MEQKIDAVEKDMLYFDRMVQGAEKLIKPWRTVAIAAIVGWAITLITFIAFAYLTPVDITQSQNFPDQMQEQSIKGAD